MARDVPWSRLREIPEPAGHRSNLSLGHHAQFPLFVVWFTVTAGLRSMRNVLDVVFNDGVGFRRVCRGIRAVRHFVRGVGYLCQMIGFQIVKPEPPTGDANIGVQGNHGMRPAFSRRERQTSPTTQNPSDLPDQNAKCFAPDFFELKDKFLVIRNVPSCPSESL